MDDIKKILVALAFTPYSEGIFNYAAKIAQSFNAQLIIGSIINSRDVSAVSKIVSMGYDVNGDHYVEDIRNERQALLEQFLAKSSFNRENIQTIIKVGNPIEELLKLIVKENINLVVMGTKGRTDLENVFVGSVADKLFRRSPVPVISCRDEKNAERLRKRIKPA
jgi:nucleotide-binding universal stress UspA family protein